MEKLALMAIQEVYSTKIITGQKVKLLRRSQPCENMQRNIMMTKKLNLEWRS